MDIESKKLDFIQAFLSVQNMQIILELEQTLENALERERKETSFEVEEFVTEIEERRAVSGKITASKIDTLFE